MIRYKTDMEKCSENKAEGGKGVLQFLHLFAPEEMGGRANMFAKVTLQPGVGVGEHIHDTEGEVYWVLSGEVTVTEDGMDTILRAGDAEFCADGHSHGIRNHTDQPAEFLAVKIPDR